MRRGPLFAAVLFGMLGAGVLAVSRLGITVPYIQTYITEYADFAAMGLGILTVLSVGLSILLAKNEDEEIEEPFYSSAPLEGGETAFDAGGYGYQGQGGFPAQEELDAEEEVVLDKKSAKAAKKAAKERAKFEAKAQKEAAKAAKKARRKGKGTEEVEEELLQSEDWMESMRAREAQAAPVQQAAPQAMQNPAWAQRPTFEPAMTVPAPEPVRPQMPQPVQPVQQMPEPEVIQPTQYVDPNYRFSVDEITARPTDAPMFEDVQVPAPAWATAAYDDPNFSVPFTEESAPEVAVEPVAQPFVEQVPAAPSMELPQDFAEAAEALWAAAHAVVESAKAEAELLRVELDEERRQHGEEVARLSAALTEAISKPVANTAELDDLRSEVNRLANELASAESNLQQVVSAQSIMSNAAVSAERQRLNARLTQLRIALLERTPVDAELIAMVDQALGMTHGAQ